MEGEREYALAHSDLGQVFAHQLRLEAVRVAEAVSIEITDVSVVDGLNHALGVGSGLGEHFG